MKRKKNLLHVTGSGSGLHGDRYRWKWERKGEKKKDLKTLVLGMGQGFTVVETLEHKPSHKKSPIGFLTLHWFRVCVCLHPQTAAGSQINRHLKKVYDMKNSPK